MVRFSIFFIIIILTFSAKTQNYNEQLIERLTRVYLRIAPGDPNRVNVTLRLADLHSEKARILARQELEEGCLVCEAGIEDRQMALRYYSEVLPSLYGDRAARVLVQVGHLYELLGKEGLAVETYRDALDRDDLDREVRATAHLSLAEIFFRRRDLGEAEKHYEQALILAPYPNGFVEYRLAWVYFYQGQIREAINQLQKILEEPTLLSRRGGAQFTGVDIGFHEEVSRDFATFQAQIDLAERRGGEIAEKIYTLSPDSIRMENTVYLAGEAERLGQLNLAQEIWDFVIQQSQDPQKRLNAHLKTTQLYFQMNDLENSLQAYEQSVHLFEIIGCDDGQDWCNSVLSELRDFAVQLNKVYEQNPRLEVLEAYRLYLRIDPKNIDVMFWSAQVAMALELKDEAYELYTRAMRVLVDRRDQTDLESTLLARIELAESLEDTSRVYMSYNDYLDHSVDRTKEWEVLYQKAYWNYDREELSRAKDLFLQIALEDHAPEKLRLQSSDMAIDALVLMGDDQKIEKWSDKLGKIFPSKNDEFMRHKKQSIFNQVAFALQEGLGADLAWKTLNRYPIEQATEEEKKIYFQNRRVLSVERSDPAETRKALTQLLVFEEEGSDGWLDLMERKIYFAELMLDFSEAKQLTEQLPEDYLDSERWLRFALYNELENRDSRIYLEKYVDHGDDKKTIRGIVKGFMDDVIDSGGDIYSEYKKFSKFFSDDTGLRVSYLLQAYKRENKPVIRTYVLEDENLSQTKLGSLFRQKNFFDRFLLFKEKIKNHQLDASSQERLDHSLRKRVTLLSELDRHTSEAIELRDWSLQLVTLNLVARERLRFFEDLMSLPLPEGLTPEEEIEYLGLLQKQSEPHRNLGISAQQRVADFWSDQDAIINYVSEVMESSQLRDILEREITLVKELAPEHLKHFFKGEYVFTEDDWIEEDENIVDWAEWTQVRESLSKRPFDLKILQRLIQLEEKRGEGAVLSYFKERYEEMSKQN